MLFNRKKKAPMAMLGVLLAILLTGCGSGTEKTQEAMKLVETLDYEGALAGFEAAEEALENQRLIARGKGIAYMGLTQYEEAISCFQEALASGSGLVQSVDFDLNYYLAAAYIKNGQPEEAEAAYNAILALRPEEKDAYFLRGSARLELGNYEGAKEDFDRVISMDAKNYERLITIYQVLAHYGYKEVGQEYLQNALDNSTRQMDAYDIGRIYYYLEEYQKAYIALEEAKEKGGAESYLYLGRAYEATGDYNYAANVYNSCLSKGNGTAEIYNQLGLCEMARGEYQKALEAFQAGIELGESDYRQTLLFNEIAVYEYLGEYETAEALLDTYMKAYPDDGEAGRELDFLSTR